MLLQQLVNGVMLGSTYALVAIGYTLIFGVLRLLHLAHGEVFMVGAFAGLQLVLLWQFGPLGARLCDARRAQRAAGLGNRGQCQAARPARGQRARLWAEILTSWLPLPT